MYIFHFSSVVFSPVFFRVTEFEKQVLPCSQICRLVRMQRACSESAVLQAKAAKRKCLCAKGIEYDFDELSGAELEQAKAAVAAGKRAKAGDHGVHERDGDLPTAAEHGGNVVGGLVARAGQHAGQLRLLAARQGEAGARER